MQLAGATLPGTSTTYSQPASDIQGKLPVRKEDAKLPFISPSQRRGLFVYFNDFDTHNGKLNFEKLLEHTSTVGFNILLPDAINSRGYANYRNGIVAQSARVFDRWKKSSDPMQKLIEEARQHNMQVWPWVQLFVGNKVLYQQHADWFATSSYGYRSEKYLDFLNPAVRRYQLGVLRDIAKRYDIGGINIDMEIQVRYASYSSLDKKMFMEDNGIKSISWPMDVRPYGRYNEMWLKWTNNKLAEFFAQTHKVLKAQRRGLVVSYDVTSNPDDDGYYDRWDAWARKGGVDAVDPMIYWRDSHYSVGLVSVLTRRNVDVASSRGADVQVTSIVGGSMNATSGMHGNEWADGIDNALAGRSDGVFVFAYICVERDHAWSSIESAFRKHDSPKQ